MISGVRLTDAHNGYRMMKREIIDDVHLTMDGMEYASELIDEIEKAGYHIYEVPVHIHYDSYTLAKGQRYGGALRIAFRMIYKKFF
jgi:polyprenyl-phospho-N-acetylgalactosaminyl synthase